MISSWLFPVIEQCLGDKLTSSLIPWSRGFYSMIRGFYSMIIYIYTVYIKCLVETDDTKEKHVIETKFRVSLKYI